MTDPRYLGAKLSTEMEDEAETMLSTKSPEFYSALMKFKLKDKEYFPERFFTENSIKDNTPSDWWKLVGI